MQYFHVYSPTTSEGSSQSDNQPLHHVQLVISMLLAQQITGYK